MRITVLLLAVALPLIAHAQGPVQYFSHPPAAPLTGTEIIGPVRQNGHDVAITTSALMAGAANLVAPTIPGVVTTTVNGLRNAANGVAGTDAQNTISSQTVVPDGGTTPQTLSSVAAAAVGAVQSSAILAPNGKILATALANLPDQPVITTALTTAPTMVYAACAAVSPCYVGINIVDQTTGTRMSCSDGSYTPAIGDASTVVAGQSLYWPRVPGGATPTLGVQCVSDAPATISAEAH